MGAFALAAQAKAQGHDLLLPGGQAAQGRKEHLPLGILLHGAVDDVRLGAQHVAEEQLVAVPIRVQRLVERDLPLLVGGLAQVHQNLVLDAPGGVGSQLDVFVHLEGVHRLDETDGADGDEILQPQPGGFELFGNVDHQAQIVDDEGLPCGSVALVQPGKNRLFLLFGERRRKGIRTVDVVHPAGRRKFFPQLGEQQAEFPENGLHEKDSFHSSSCG